VRGVPKEAVFRAAILSEQVEEEPHSMLAGDARKWGVYKDCFKLKSH
jgi:hypothetical protein